MLFALALLAVSALAAASLQHYARIRSSEAELLRIGGEFRRALASYREAAAPQVYPEALEDLLLDRRTGSDRRHLRKVYFDPVTGRREWGMVTEQGRIVGIHSLSQRSPMKVSGFDPENAGFEDAVRYSDWIFRAEPVPADLPPATDGALQGGTGG
ncbi:type II secretion system protein [Luteimonas sp. SJ-92]|uniref:Type II secretion system protein n=1 Tax=Luteimonas salinisoli TaxID=2752307 RepID=A0A853J8G9_9GAMM|nr:type II secretion system protein [Luteimonas salinisoli]NZA25165.1 type II secretion system protein [Luteimonas salinisoli]